METLRFLTAATIGAIVSLALFYWFLLACPDKASVETARAGAEAFTSFPVVILESSQSVTVHLACDVRSTEGEWLRLTDKVYHLSDENDVVDILPTKAETERLRCKVLDTGDPADYVSIRIIHGKQLMERSQ